MQLPLSAPELLRNIRLMFCEKLQRPCRDRIKGRKVMTNRSCLRCYCAATFLCFAVMNIGPACAQNEMPRAAAQLEQLVAPLRSTRTHCCRRS